MEMARPPHNSARHYRRFDQTVENSPLQENHHRVSTVAHIEFRQNVVCLAETPRR